MRRRQRKGGGITLPPILLNREDPALTSPELSSLLSDNLLLNRAISFVDTALYFCPILSDLGDKMSAEEKGKVNSKLDELKRAIEANDGARMKSSKEELERTIQEFSTRLYQAAGQGAPNASDVSASGSTGSAGASSSDGDTVDAEFSDQGQA